MTKEQVDQYNMLLAVETHFDDNTTIWTTNIPIAEAKTALTDTIGEIATAIRLQRNTSSGATMDKALLRTDLEQKGFSLSSSVSAYSSTHPGQNQKLSRLYIVKSDLLKLRENDLLAYIEELNAGAMLVIEALGAYGVTQSTLTDLMDARDAFREMIKEPGEVTSSRGDATKAIPVLLHQGIAGLDSTMDKLMDAFKPTEPQFANVYFADRKIHRIGKRTLSLEITTLNANDNTPLDDAHLEVVGKGIKRVSSKSGMNRVQNLVEGNYTLSVNRLGFVPQMIPFMVLSSQTTQVVVEMQSIL